MLRTLVKRFTRDYDGKMIQNAKNTPNDLGKVRFSDDAASENGLRDGQIRLPARATGRRGQIVRTARMHCEAFGARKLSVSKVASELGVTRELIYYYFDGKRALVDAVLDDYVVDFADKAVAGAMRSQTIETLEMIAILRQAIFDESGSLQAGFKVIEDLRLREEFLSRATDAIVVRLTQGGIGIPRDDDALSGKLGWLKLLAFGIAGTMLHDPSISDAELASMVNDATGAEAFPGGAA